MRRTAEHASFVIERTFPVDPARVFRAWASAEEKLRWFGPPSPDGYELDFRIDGHELFASTAPDGARYRYDAVYRDIIDGERIVYTYEMHRDEDRISVSVATIEFAAAEGGTVLKLTEQGAYLDGHDTVDAREHGTRAIIEKLAAVVSA